MSKNVPPRPEWTQGLMSSIRLNQPVKVLQQTALFRLLAADLTQAVQPPSPSNCLPPDVSSPAQREVQLRGPITVQVMDVEDIGHSRWSQFEHIEAQERGETKQGQEMIRVVPEDTESDTSSLLQSTGLSGPHKVLLQDARGTKMFGFELIPVNGIGLNMSIGCKLVLRTVTVARGVALLQPKSVEVLGGKIDAWHKQWRSERKEILKEKAGFISAG